MANFPNFVPRIPQIAAVQWSNDPEVVDDLRVWLNTNYGPETPGLIEEFADDPGLSAPGPLGWEIAEDGRLFVKQSEDKFWANLGDWLVFQNGEMAPMSDAAFQAAYQES